MDERRVFEVWSSAGRFGTGYLVTDGALLTSWHTVGAPGEVEVRPLSGGSGAWLRARVVWPSVPPDIDAAPGADAALLGIEDTRWEPPAARPVLWGRVTGDEQRPCRAIGFPGSEQRGPVRDTKDISGRIERFTGVKSGLITVHVDGSAAPSAPAERSWWAGASGAGLFCDEWLVGVLTTDRTAAYSADQLAAVPVAAFAEDPHFRAALGSSPEVQDLPTRPGAAGGAVPEPGNLPEPRSAVFVGREHELRRVAERMHGAPGGVRVVHGLGGVGKTSLALEFAHSRAHEYRSVWWIEADGPEAVTRGLGDLARTLPGVAGTDDTDERAAAAATGWLRANPGWLLVLDNAAAPSELAPVLGTLRRAGHVLITSRFASGWPDPEPVGLGVLDEDTAVELLTRLTGPTGDDRDGDERRGPARELAAELGHLPLALNQAGSFIAESRIPYGEYLGLLRRSPSDLLATGAMDSPEEKTVARTWRVTLDRIARTAPLSVELLRILAWFAPSGIPRDLLGPLHQEGRTGTARSGLRIAENPVALHKALGVLRSYSLISLEQDSIAVHRLVQAITRLPDPDDPHRAPEAVSASRERAARLLLAGLPINPQANTPSWPRGRALLPHVAVLASSGAAQDSETCMRVWEGTSNFLRSQDQGDAAVGYAERALAVAERLHGRDSDTATFEREVLAAACHATGELDRAVGLYEQVMRERERTDGDMDHPWQIATRQAGTWIGLADVHLSRERPDLAVELYERTVEVWEQALEQLFPPQTEPQHGGGSNPRERLAGEAPADPFSDDEGVQGFSAEAHVLRARDGLSVALSEAGSTERAVEIAEGVASDSERLFGPDHRDTQRFLFHLGFAYLRAGRPRDALGYFERTAESARRLIGPGHPDTIASVEGLALAHLECGHTERAIQLRGQILADAERVMGTGNEHTRRFRRILARMYRSTGEYERAVELLRAELDVAEGSDPDSVPGVLLDLAAAHVVAGMHELAEPLLRRCVDGGDGLPEEELLEARLLLADSVGRGGRPSEAEALLEQVVSDAGERLHPDHPVLYGARARLATHMAGSGRYEHAIELSELNLDVDLRQFGENSANAIISSAHLSELSSAAGRDEEAADHCRRALQGLRDSPDPPASVDPLELRLQLATACTGSGQHREAVDTLAAVLDDPVQCAEAGEEWAFVARRIRASAHLSLGEPRDAAQLLRVCLSHAERLFPDSEEPASVLTQLGLSLLASQQPEQALAPLESAVPELVRRHGERSPTAIGARQNLAMALINTGDRERGLAMLRACVHDAEETLGRSDGMTQALHQVLAEELGETEGPGPAPRPGEPEAHEPPDLDERLRAAREAEEAGDLGTAIDVFRGILASVERGFGPESETAFSARARLADLHRSAGEHGVAADLHEQVADGLERIHGPESHEAVSARADLAVSLVMADEWERGLPEFERVGERSDRTGAGDHRIALALNFLASSREGSGDFEGARRSGERALAMAEVHLGENHSVTRSFRFRLASQCVAAGDPERAEDLLGTFLAEDGSWVGVEDAADPAVFLRTFAEACEGAGHPADAAHLYGLALDVLEGDPDADTGIRIEARYRFAVALLAAGSGERALPELQRARDEAYEALPSGHWLLHHIRNHLGIAHYALDEHDRAVAELAELLSDTERELGTDDPLTETVRDNLRHVQEEVGDEHA